MTNITATQGDTIILSTVISRKDPETDTTTPVDLTSATVWFTAKYSLADDDADAVVQLNTETGGVTKSATPEDGHAVIKILPEKTNALSDHTVWLFWDIELDESDGTVTTVDSGRLALVNDATKA